MKKSEIEIKAPIDFFKASKPAWIFFYSSSFLTSVADRIICYIMIYGYFSFFFIPNKVLYTKSSVANDMQFESWCQEICLIKRGWKKFDGKASMHYAD